MCYPTYTACLPEKFENTDQKTKQASIKKTYLEIMKILGSREIQKSC